ncbi:hypothetical protein PDESU_01239 [Pontiella desulfatans]|uniref:Uncharacterized protein n=1 Tax=Pontiella desulfatans TaxID=2750659 RepID=A0A6C2TZU2_PONDE|nr:hypothetical protein PDESU_01239 [Pontiella desulfatans]
MILDSLYYMALNSAKKMALELGENKDIFWHDEWVDTLKKEFNRKCWKGKYYSSNAKKFQDDRANALASLSGLAGAEKQPSIVGNVLIPNQYCSPHFEWMVEEAMCYARYYEAALKCIKERYQLHCGCLVIFLKDFQRSS